MSVIVKGMAMPSCCYECRFIGNYIGDGNKEVFYCEAHLKKIGNPREGRLDTCPLVEEMPSAKEFADKMRGFVEDFYRADYDEEGLHINADEAMCDLLVELGYQDAVNVFKDMPKWYA